MTRKIILVLPNPDCIILSAVHKYMNLKEIPHYHSKQSSDSQTPYQEAYTLTTLQTIDQPTTVTKILIIGHGKPGMLREKDDILSIAQVLCYSKVIFSQNLKIVFDACYASQSTDNGSVILALKLAIAKNLPKTEQSYSYRIIGYGGPVVSGGTGGRLVITDFDEAYKIQMRLLDQQQSFLQPFSGWQDNFNSDTIFAKAAIANRSTQDFFHRFRQELTRQNLIIPKNTGGRRGEESQALVIPQV